MGEIAIGCLAASLSRRYVPSKIGAGLLLVGGAASMVLVLYFRHAVNALRLYEFGLDVTVLSCGTAAVLIALSAIPTGARATNSGAWAPLRWLGRNSYEVYLSHLFVVLPASLLIEKKRPFDGPQQCLAGRRLLQEILGACLHRSNSSSDVAVTR